jgi:hypothetical protein
MKCEDLKNIIPEYLEGDLDQFDMDEISSHLFSCTNCRKEVELYEKTWMSLDNWEEISPSSGFQAAVMQEIRKEHKQNRKSLIDIIMSMFRFHVPAWAAVLMIISGIFVNNTLVYMSGDTVKPGNQTFYVEPADYDTDSRIAALTDAPATLFPRAGELLNDELTDVSFDSSSSREWDSSSVFDRVDIEELFNM